MTMTPTQIKEMIIDAKMTLQVADNDGWTSEDRSRSLANLAIAAATKIDALQAELARFRANVECSYCDAVFALDDPLQFEHWRECDKHPAKIEIDRLRAENEALREVAAGLIAYRDAAGPLNFQLEKADDFINALRAALGGE
jgi:hypothetical protein